jgi:hypothetical protein
MDPIGKQLLRLPQLTPAIFAESLDVSAEGASAGTYRNDDKFCVDTRYKNAASQVRLETPRADTEWQDLSALRLLSLGTGTCDGFASELTVPVSARIAFSLDANLIPDIFDARAALSNVFCRSLRPPLSYCSTESDFSVTDFNFDLARIEVGTVS